MLLAYFLLRPFALVASQVAIVGSTIGSPDDFKEMFKVNMIPNQVTTYCN